MNDEALLADLARVEVLRMAAAAAPAIDRLNVAGLDLGITEAEAHGAIMVPKGVAIWCRKVQQAEVWQGLAPAQEEAGARSPEKTGLAKSDCFARAINTTHCYQQDSSADLVADWIVLSLPDGAGRAEAVQAISANAAEALVLASHSAAITSVLPAAAVEGCNRTVLLWEWMGTVT
jgi:hypothetical protein